MEPGDTVVWRETWHGRTWIAMPVRLVERTESSVALYVAEGTSFRFLPEQWPWARPHPWAGRRWQGPGVLVTHRPGAAHSIWHFWRESERAFAGWYVNLQAPFAWDGYAFDTLDHELDLWIEPDGSWRWKDESLMDERVREGRFTEAEAAAIRAEGERVLAAWPFPTGWEDWRPDPDWAVPELPPEWSDKRADLP